MLMFIAGPEMDTAVLEALIPLLRFIKFIKKFCSIEDICGRLMGQKSEANA